jgi:hypothetical protein
VAQGAAHRVAVHVGEVDVEQDEVEGALLVGRLQALRPGARLEHLELLRLLRLEDRADEGAGRDVVVDDEDSLGHCVSPGSVP